MSAVLGQLLSASPRPEPVADARQWWERHLRVRADETGGSSAERAARAAFEMDRLGWAFASGYQEALQALVPDLGARRVAMCATEEGGAHPRAIHARLESDGDGFRLTGVKHWTTLGTQADELLVVASTGQHEDGRNRLRVVRVPAGREGVHVIPLDETPFIPEVPHARTELEAVRVEASEVLEGDGYARFLKPFRTIEDVHVHAALLAYLVQIARRTDWPPEHVERLMALLSAAFFVAGCDPREPATHRALAGLIEATRMAVADAEPCWERVEAEVRSRWERDRPLLQVASRARTARRDRARGSR